jgi:hypothetical protein
MGSSVSASWTQSRRFHQTEVLRETSERQTVAGVESSNDAEKGADHARAPRTGVRLMVIILVGLGLLAIYANIQAGRRDKIEKVTVIPVSTATPSAAPAGR